MSLIVWHDNLSVKVTEIDEQHKTLIQMINDLGDAMKNGTGRDVIGNSLNRLVRYTESHFANEEKYFLLFKYPNTAKHKKEHVAFVRQLTAFKEGFEQGKKMVSIEVLVFLTDWLRNHIQGTDKQYSNFFNECGLN